MTFKASAEQFVRKFSFQNQKHPKDKSFQVILSISKEWLALIENPSISSHTARAFLETVERADDQIRNEAGSAWVDLFGQIHAWAHEPF